MQDRIRRACVTPIMTPCDSVHIWDWRSIVDTGRIPTRYSIPITRPRNQGNVEYYYRLCFPRRPMGDCCVKGMKHEGEPVGRIESIAGIETYISDPPVGTTGRRRLSSTSQTCTAPFYINAKLLQDHFASHGTLHISVIQPAAPLIIVIIYKATPSWGSITSSEIIFRAI